MSGNCWCVILQHKVGLWALSSHSRPASCMISSGYLIILCLGCKDVIPCTWIPVAPNFLTFIFKPYSCNSWRFQYVFKWIFFPQNSNISIPWRLLPQIFFLVPFLSCSFLGHTLDLVFVSNSTCTSHSHLFPLSILLLSSLCLELLLQFLNLISDSVTFA